MKWLCFGIGMLILRSAGSTRIDFEQVPAEYRWVFPAWLASGALLAVCGLWGMATDRSGLRVAWLLGGAGAIAAGYLRATGAVAAMQCTGYT